MQTFCRTSDKKRHKCLAERIKPVKEQRGALDRLVCVCVCGRMRVHVCVCTCVAVLHASWPSGFHIIFKEFNSVGIFVFLNLVS